MDQEPLDCVITCNVLPVETLSLGKKCVPAWGSISSIERLLKEHAITEQSIHINAFQMIRERAEISVVLSIYILVLTYLSVDNALAAGNSSRANKNPQLNQSTTSELTQNPFVAGPDTRSPLFRMRGERFEQHGTTYRMIQPRYWADEHGNVLHENSDLSNGVTGFLNQSDSDYGRDTPSTMDMLDSALGKLYDPKFVPRYIKQPAFDASWHFWIGGKDTRRNFTITDSDSPHHLLRAESIVDMSPPFVAQTRLRPGYVPLPDEIKEVIEAKASVSFAVSYLAPPIFVWRVNGSMWQ